MGPRRAGVVLVATILVAALLPLVTRAQTGEEERDSAYSLLSDAVANRDEVERQLALAMEDYLRVANELAIKSASADRLAAMVESARADLEAVDAIATDQVISAYMEAVMTPPGVMLASGSVEHAMVISPTLEFLTGESEQLATGLQISQRDLLALQTLLSAEIVEVQALKGLAEETAGNLTDLFAAADAEVGAAIANALAADAAYRAEMDRIEAAQAEAAEAARQQERATTTTSAAGSSSTSLPPPPSIGDAPLKPAVEQWRPLVAAYFPTALVEPALAIMQCESLGDPNAYNPYSGASGLFQFLPGTWAVMAPKAGFAGVSPFDPEANIATAAWLAGYYESLGRDPWTPWYCTP